LALLKPTRIQRPTHVKPGEGPTSSGPAWHSPDHISGTAVPEYGPTEISSPVGAVSKQHAGLCRPGREASPAHPRRKPGFSIFESHAGERRTLRWREMDSNSRSPREEEPTRRGSFVRPFRHFPCKRDRGFESGPSVPGESVRTPPTWRTIGRHTLEPHPFRSTHIKTLCYVQFRRLGVVAPRARALRRQCRASSNRLPPDRSTRSE